MIVGIFPYIATAALLIAVFLIFPKKISTKKFGIALTCVAVALEIFVFNFHSFHLVGGGYEQKTLDIDDAVIRGFDKKAQGLVSNADGNEVSVEFLDLGIKAGTVRVETDYITDGISSVDLSIDASDSTNEKSYRYGVATGQIIRGNKRSECIILNLSGEVGNLRIRATASDGEIFAIKSITLNSPKPIELSPWRLLLTVGFVFAIYALSSFPSMKESVESKRSLFKINTAVITCVLCAIAAGLTVIYNTYQNGYVFSSFKETSGNQITKELVDAFRNGQVHLLQEPSEELLALENPYDWSARSEAGVPYLWDHLLYNGKYYSYYGIAPVILLFLPYNLITGYYFPTPEAVMIFGIVGIVFLSLLYFEVIKRFFEKIPLNVAICSLLVLQLCCGVWYCFCSPLFYEIAQASGFMFTMMGGYFLIRSGVVGKGKISRVSLCISSLCLSLAVLCRPTLALYCVAALVFIAYGFFKDRRIAKSEGRSTLKSAFGYLASSLLCFAIVGGVQMIYNYMRFGSALDFGIQYSLTINDFTRAQYHTDFALIGFWNFLFAFPQVRPEFPFVFSNFSTLDINGYYFVANRNAVGLIWRALPMLLGYCCSFGALRRLEKGKKLQPALIILSACVAAPLIIIFSIWESGYGVRYSADFAVEMILGGMAILYFICIGEKERSRETVMRFAEKFFILSFAVALIINSAMIYDYLSDCVGTAVEFLNVERIFEFWR